MNKELLEFDEKKHIYKYDGKYIPSVTQVLKSISIELYKFVPEKYMIAAAKRGQSVHFAIDMYDKYGLEIIEDEYRKRFEAYKQFKIDYQHEVILGEYMVVSEKMYAGTLDNIAYITVDGKRKKTLGDFKNTSELYVNLVGLQLSGYNQCIFEEGITDIESYWSLNLKEDGTYDFHEYTKEEILNYYEDFKFYLEVIEKNKFYITKEKKNVKRNSRKENNT